MDTEKPVRRKESTEEDSVQEPPVKLSKSSAEKSTENLPVEAAQPTEESSELEMKEVTSEIEKNEESEKTLDAKFDEVEKNMSEVFEELQGEDEDEIVTEDEESVEADRSGTNKEASEVETSLGVVGVDTPEEEEVAIDAMEEEGSSLRITCASCGESFGVAELASHALSCTEVAQVSASTLH